MSPNRLSELELRKELEEQCSALRASAEAYDAGNYWEAKRLASTAYILLHDGGRNSRSLLGQLRLKGDMISTAKHGGESPIPLAVITIRLALGEPKPMFTPLLDEHSTTRNVMKFNKWYGEKIFEEGNLSISRKNLICTLRSQAGGAHVDDVIKNDAFLWLKRSSPYHTKMEKSDRPPEYDSLPDEIKNMIDFEYDGPVINGHLASMRQIAWEIDYFLKSIGI